MRDVRLREEQIRVLYGNNTVHCERIRMEDAIRAARIPGMRDVIPPCIDSEERSESANLKTVKLPPVVTPHARICARKDGKIVATFQHKSDAADWAGVRYESIRDAIPTGMQVAGYTWERQFQKPRLPADSIFCKPIHCVEADHTFADVYDAAEYATGIAGNAKAVRYILAAALQHDSGATYQGQHFRFADTEAV